MAGSGGIMRSYRYLHAAVTAVVLACPGIAQAQSGLDTPERGSDEVVVTGIAVAAIRPADDAAGRDRQARQCVLGGESGAGDGPRRVAMVGRAAHPRPDREAVMTFPAPRPLSGTKENGACWPRS